MLTVCCRGEVWRGRAAQRLGAHPLHAGLHGSEGGQRPQAQQRPAQLRVCAGEGRCFLPSRVCRLRLRVKRSLFDMPSRSHAHIIYIEGRYYDQIVFISFLDWRYLAFPESYSYIHAWKLMTELYIEREHRYIYSPRKAHGRKLGNNHVLVLIVLFLVFIYIERE